jgi:hypothetical protein
MTEKATSKSALARELGVHRHTVDGMIQRGTIPEQGPWDIEQCRVAIAEERQRREQATPEAELKAELLRRQILRIEGRTQATVERAQRLRRRLARERAGYPRLDLLRLLLAGWPSQLRANVSAHVWEPIKSNDPHPAVAALVLAEAEAHRRLANLPTETETRTKEALP